MNQDSPNQEQNVINEQEQQSDSHTKFDADLAALIDNFGEACQELQINEAIVLANIPGNPNPLVFARGDVLSVSTLMASVLREFKRDIMAKLDT